MPSERHPLHDRLPELVGEEHVLSRPEDIGEYRRDKSPFPELEPAIVVRPGTVEEVQQIMQMANEAGVPVFARGNGFSLSGFPPLRDDRLLVLDTRRLNRIVEVDEVDMTVTAECGVIMSDLEKAVEASGFEVQTAAVPPRHTTLGGVLSGVVGGGLPREMPTLGGTGQFVLGLTIVLPDGTLLRTNARGSNIHRSKSVVASTDGPTLTPLFIGDGGLLGLKVEATLQLLPVAPYKDAGAWMFDDFDQAWRALLDLTAFRELPYSTLGIAEDPPGAFTFGVRAGDPALVAQRMELLRRTLAAHGGREGDAAQAAYALAALNADPEWAQEFIDTDRALVAFLFGKSTFRSAYARIREHLDDRFAQDDLASLGLRLLVYFSPYGRHAVYTTLSIIFDPLREGARERTSELATETYRLVAELGGHPEPHQGAAATIAAEAWSPEVRRLIEGIKQLVDPRATLNRGLWGLGVPSEQIE